MSTCEKELKIYTDGASRGNPGDAAWAYIIFGESDDVVSQQAGYIGKSTNNQAEYFAVIRALQQAKQLKSPKLKLHSDSQLLIKQVNGEWKVKNPELARLFDRVNKLTRNFNKICFLHLPRNNERIQEADQLCNFLLDEIQNS